MRIAKGGITTTSRWDFFANWVVNLGFINKSGCHACVGVSYDECSICWNCVFVSFHNTVVYPPDVLEAEPLIN